MLSILKRPAPTLAENKQETLSPSTEDDKQKDYAKIIQDIINGKYVPIDDCSDSVCAAINKLSTHISTNNHKALEDMVSFSMQASESLASISFVSGDMKEVSESTQAIAASIEELSAASSDISKNSNNVVDNSRATQEAISAGEAAVNESVQSINTIAESMDTANQKIQTLSESVAAIVEILGTIENIAKQTNLLALNATIEAARAGEAGKGFAVVATEVKTLAGQTAGATENIRDMINAISSGMDDVSNAMIESVAATNTGRDSVHKAGEEITRVVENIHNTTEIMASVASSVTQQDAAIREIAQSIENISGKTKRAAQNAQTSSEVTLKTAQLVDKQLQGFADMNIPNSVLDFAKSDHVLWKKNLGAMLSGQSSLTADELSNHHVCRLGKWYYSIEDENIKNHPSYIKLEEVHAKVHNHGKKCAELFGHGDRVGATEEYEKMTDASKYVLEYLDDIKASIKK